MKTCRMLSLLKVLQLVVNLRIYPVKEIFLITEFWHRP